MNASLLCCAVALASTAPADDSPPLDSATRVGAVFRETTPAFAIPAHVGPANAAVVVVRGQTPVPVYDGSNGFQATPPPVYSPGGGGPVLGGPQPLVDPFLGPGPAVVPAVSGTMFPFSIFRVGPPSVGGHTTMSLGLISSEAIDGGGRTGELGVTEFDLEMRYETPTGGWILSHAPQVGSRWWDGPSGGFGIAGDLYRFGWDFEARTAPELGPWGAVVGFNPSINTDFERELRSDAYNWDGRAYLTYTASPALVLIGGFGYWDRVDDRVIPYAGAIWKPNSRWEIQAAFPESRVSYFLGNCGAGCHWIYARAEYHVEAYQVETSGSNRGGIRQVDKVEIQDYRILLGYALSNGWVDGFVEAGWVLGRETDFLSDTVPDFDIDDGFIGRVGIRF